jgi:hypothetical protein
MFTIFIHNGLWAGLGDYGVAFIMLMFLPLVGDKRAIE